jgi:uncharacterized protein YfbU (UPF0304 family)
MSTQRELRNWIVAIAKEYPELTNEIYDAYDLFVMEIEDEEASVQHESELCISEVMHLIDMVEKKYKTNTTANR